MEKLTQYFLDLSEIQLKQFDQLPNLYVEWNAKINVISRKDIDDLMTRHVLHSLAVARFWKFKPGQKILDIGTGGGFPGIPLAIFFPQVSFTLCDSILKKTKVAKSVVETLGLQNVEVVNSRAEHLAGGYDYVVCRAVTGLSKLCEWTKPLLRKTKKPGNDTGLIALKGGDLADEIAATGRTVQQQAISAYFHSPFFEEKYVLFVPIRNRVR